MKSTLFYLFLLLLCAVMYYSDKVTPIIYGVCIFLYAMSVLNSSFKLITGIDIFLKKMTTTRFRAFTFGFSTCTLMQSSGLVSVLAISFLSAGLISLVAGLAIIFGANLGCLTGAWLVAAVGLKIDIAAYAAPMIIIGLFCSTSSTKGVKGLGLFLFSIGLLFMGIHFMKSGFDSIKESVDLSQYAMSGVTGLLVYFAIGIIITVIMQSSHATITLAITALSAAQISYENSVAIVIGSNIGSTVMAVIGALSANIEGRKLTVAHVIFNVTTAVLMLIFVNFFLWLTDYTAFYMNIADDDYTLKLAIFNSYFQVLGVLIFYPLTSVMAKMLNKYVKANKTRSKVSTAKYLTEEALEFSDSALNVLVKELGHLYDNASSIIAKSISISKADIKSAQPIGEVISARNRAMDIDFDELYNNRFKEVYNQIIEYDIQATQNAKPDDVSKFMDIRRLALILAELLKDIKNSQPNFYRFINSSNKDAKDAYDKLRVKILFGLRAVYEAINTPPDQDGGLLAEEKLNALDQLMQMLEYEGLHLDVLLREKRISGSIATSLMNDTALVRSSVKLLKEIVVVLNKYATVPEHMQEEAEAINNEEIEQKAS